MKKLINKDDIRTRNIELKKKAIEYKNDESSVYISDELLEKWRNLINRLSKIIDAKIVFIEIDYKFLISDSSYDIGIYNNRLIDKKNEECFLVRWPNKELFGYFCNINKKVIDVDMIEILKDYVAFVEKDLELLIAKENYQILERHEKNICKIAEIEKHNKKILSKSFAEKDDILSIYQFDLNTGIIIDNLSKYKTIDWKDKDIDSLIDFNFVNISEKDRAKYLFFYSLDFMRDSAKREKRISIVYDQKFREANVLVKATLEFVNYPDEEENTALLFIQDITIQNELSKLLDVIVEVQNEYVFRADLNTRRVNIYANRENFLSFNTGFSNLNFSEYDEKIDDFFKDLTCEYNKYIKSTKDIFEVIKKGETLNTSIEYKDVDNKTVIKRATFYRRKRDDDSAFVIVQDVTDVVIHEKLMRNELENTLHEVQKSKQIADDANDIKDLFLSNMSHEMRTPLNAIIGLTNFGIKETTEDNDREYYRKIKSNSEYLLLLITDMLDLQKIASDTLFLERKIFRLTDLRRIILNIVSSKIAEKKINFKTEFEEFEMFPYIKSDEKRIGQAIINLLTNAIKYSEVGGVISWKSETIGYTDDKVIKKYTIKDNGIGMSESFQKHMYKPFFRKAKLDYLDQKGTGLGLAICKNIIESMNGTIKCKSKLGEGTEFTIIIPYTVASDEEIDAYLMKLVTCDSHSKLHNRKILVCDDVKVNAVILRKILSSEGMLVDIASNGKEALDKVKENNFDAILMDIRMPVMDGLEATREIRKFDLSIPIIAVSANAYKADIEKSIKAGMNEHVSKPIRREHLLNCLEKFIV